MEGFGSRSIEFGCSPLIPNNPRHGVFFAGEGDVGLDTVARRVDVQAGVPAEAQDARLLPAEATDGGNVPTFFHAFWRDVVAVRFSRAEWPLHEDLVRFFDREYPHFRRLLPGDPRPRFGGIHCRAAGYRRVFGVLGRVDVQRRNRRPFFTTFAAALAGEDPLAARVVEAAGED